MSTRQNNTYLARPLDPATPAEVHERLEESPTALRSWLTLQREFDPALEVLMRTAAPLLAHNGFRIGIGLRTGLSARGSSDVAGIHFELGEVNTPLATGNLRVGIRQAHGAVYVFAETWQKHPGLNDLMSVKLRTSSHEGVGFDHGEFDFYDATAPDGPVTIAHRIGVGTKFPRISDAVDAAAEMLTVRLLEVFYLPQLKDMPA